MKFFCKCGRDVGKLTLEVVRDHSLFLCQCGKGYVIDAELEEEVQLARKIRTAVEESTEALIKDILERL